VKWTIQVHWADRMWVVLHPTDWDATIVLGPSEGGLGGQDALDGFPPSGRNAYTSGANAFFADALRLGLAQERPATLGFASWLSLKLGNSQKSDTGV